MCRVCLNCVSHPIPPITFVFFYFLVSRVQYSWSLSSIFGQLRGLVFSELKMRLWRAAIERTENNGGGGNMSVNLDNLRAAAAPLEHERRAPAAEVHCAGDQSISAD